MYSKTNADNLYVSFCRLHLIQSGGIVWSHVCHLDGEWNKEADGCQVTVIVFSLLFQTDPQSVFLTCSRLTLVFSRVQVFCQICFQTETRWSWICIKQEEKDHKYSVLSLDILGTDACQLGSLRLLCLIEVMRGLWLKPAHTGKWNENHWPRAAIPSNEHLSPAHTLFLSDSLLYN